MYTLKGGTAFVLAIVPAARQASASDVPSASMDDSVLLIWILVGVFVFFALVLGFTWRLLKSERDRIGKRESGGTQ